jgi:hypothetical protein
MQSETATLGDGGNVASGHWRRDRSARHGSEDELDNEANRGYRGGHLSRGSMGNRGALGAGHIDRTDLSAGSLIGGGSNAGFGAGGNWYTSDPSLDGYSGTMGDETDLAGYGRATPMGGVGRELEPNYAGRGSKNYRRSDARIEEDVHEALLRDRYVDATDIDVRVENGEVTLFGEVANRNERRRAEEIVEQCAGVRDVHNEIKARQPLWSGAPSGRTTPAAEREVTSRPLADTVEREPETRRSSASSTARNTSTRGATRR